jgi:hypothetical protein
MRVTHALNNRQFSRRMFLQAGGCRTNAETTINELEDVAELKGHHLVMVYGDHAKALRRFCQLYGIEATT